MSAPYSCGCCGGPPLWLCTTCDHVVSDRALCQCYCRPNGTSTTHVRNAPTRVVYLDIRKRGRAGWFALHGVRVVWTCPPGVRVVRDRTGRRVARRTRPMYS